VTTPPTFFSALGVLLLDTRPASGRCVSGCPVNESHLCPPFSPLESGLIGCWEILLSEPCLLTPSRRTRFLARRSRSSLLPARVVISPPSQVSDCRRLRPSNSDPVSAGARPMDEGLQRPSSVPLAAESLPPLLALIHELVLPRLFLTFLPRIG